MKNPIEVLFAPGSILLLKDRPGALRRVAEKLKPFLMASVHPDRGLEATPGLASEISEAFNRIKESTDEELETLILEFARDQRGENMRIELRALRDEVRRLEKATSLKQRELKKANAELAELRDETFSSSVSSWQWFATGIPFKVSSLQDIPTSVLPNGAIPRGLLHHFRIVVRQENINDSKKKEYKGYQFDISGRVRLTVHSDTLEGASFAGLLKDREPSFGSTVLKREPGEVLIGSADEAEKGIPLVRAVHEGLVRPYVEVGRVPVFASVHSYRRLQTSSSFGLYTIHPERIVDIISIKKGRKEMQKPVVKKTSKSFSQRLKDSKRQKK